MAIITSELFHSSQLALICSVIVERIVLCIVQMVTS